MGISHSTVVVYGAILNESKSKAVYEEIRSRYLALNPGISEDEFDEEFGNEFEIEEVMTALFPQLTEWRPTFYNANGGDTWAGVGINYEADEWHVFGLSIAEDGEDVARNIIKASKTLPALNAAFQALMPVFHAAGVKPDAPDFHTVTYTC